MGTRRANQGQNPLFFQSRIAIGKESRDLAVTDLRIIANSHDLSIPTLNQRKKELFHGDISVVQQHHVDAIIKYLISLASK